MSSATFSTFCARNRDHELMVVRIVADVARAVLLFQTADAMHQAGRARQGPGARKPLVAVVGQELVRLPSRRPGMLDFDPAASLLTSGIRHGSEPLAM